MILFFFSKFFKCHHKTLEQNSKKKGKKKSIKQNFIEVSLVSLLCNDFGIGRSKTQLLWCVFIHRFFHIFSCHFLINKIVIIIS